VDDVLVLEYGSPDALAILREQAPHLAAVLVEPVQRAATRSYNLASSWHELRRITERHGAALIFDEMTPGSASCPVGAQAWFGVRADRHVRQDPGWRHADGAVAGARGSWTR